MTMFNPNSHFADTFRNMKDDKSDKSKESAKAPKPAVDRAQLQSWSDELDDISWLLGGDQVDNALDRLDVVISQMDNKLKEMK